MSKEWFIQFENHHKGPFSYHEIIGLWKENSIAGDTFFWKEGMEHWQRMDQVESFCDLFPPSELPKVNTEKLYEKGVDHRRDRSRWLISR